MTQSPHEDSHRDRLKRSQATRRDHAVRGTERLSRLADAGPKASKPSIATQSAPLSEPDEMLRPASYRLPPSATTPQVSVPISPMLQVVFGLVVLGMVVLLVGVALGSNWGVLRAFISGRLSSALLSNEVRVTPRVSATPNLAVSAGAAPANQKRVGIVSGHRGNDSGSVCADGYTEAELVYQVSVAVASQLRARGYAVDILDEFDTRLDGYASSVFVSIHADSCTYYNDLLTGFKVARSELSAVPAIEDKLVACLRDRYGKSTGLKWNSNTITHDMTNYHAFRKIAPQTPAVIIELGFLNLDRETLQKRTNKVIEGVLDGILCFAAPN